MTHLTSSELQEARDLVDAATPGLDSPAAAPGWCWRQLAENVFQVERCQAWSALFKRSEDAHFIAASRTLVPRLLDHCDELAAENERLGSICDQLMTGLMEIDQAERKRIADCKDDPDAPEWSVGGMSLLARISIILDKADV